MENNGSVIGIDFSLALSSVAFPISYLHYLFSCINFLAYCKDRKLQFLYCFLPKNPFLQWSCNKIYAFISMLLQSYNSILHSRITLYYQHEATMKVQTTSMKVHNLSWTWYILNLIPNVLSFFLFSMPPKQFWLDSQEICSIEWYSIPTSLCSVVKLQT